MNKMYKICILVCALVLIVASGVTVIKDTDTEKVISPDKWYENVHGIAHANGGIDKKHIPIPKMHWSTVIITGATE